jgi:hypothetical protein
MNETIGDVMATVGATLAGDELKDRPRALLLLRLCQLSLLFSPEKTEHYWSLLVPLQAKVPSGCHTDFEQVRSTMGPVSKSASKGFAAEVIADMEAARNMAASDMDGAKRRLHDCEWRLEKRRWPFGKALARIALVEAWATIDRQHTLELLGTIPAWRREGFIQRMHQAQPLLAEEWSIVAREAGLERAARIALKILEGAQPQLTLPKEIILKIGEEIRDSMRLITTAQDEAKLGAELARYAKLMMLLVGGEQADLIPTLVEDMYVFLTETPSLARIWPNRFTMVASILEVGVSLNALSDKTLEGLLDNTPSYLIDFVRAHYTALTASSADAEKAYSVLLANTQQSRDGEAWFLVSLVKRGLGTEAMGIAEKSDCAEDLLPRLRRAWLCTHPESARSTISSTDMAGDPIGEFLAQGIAQDRVAYLREATDGGARSVPGEMWAGTGVETESEGLRGFWRSLTSSTKSLGQVASEYLAREYLARNPLYSSYRGYTSGDEQFSEYLRIHGYGEYRYSDIDRALLETLVVWGDEDAAEARSVLRSMWDAIQPDDEILKVDWLRNAIFTRCRTVLAADPEVLLQDYLGWFKMRLVDSGLYWQSGKTQYTLRFPNTAPLQFCVASAVAVSGLSPSRRDQILLSGLDAFPGDSSTVEAVAQAYSADKKVLDLTLPVELKSNLAEAWQFGVVRNSIPHIFKAMVAQASG